MTLADYLTTESGPNVSTCTLDLFESDASIAKRAARLARCHSQAGSPIRLNNKLLCLSDIMLTGDKEPVPWAVVGDAAGLARRINLKTGQTLTTFRGHGGPVSAILVTRLPLPQDQSKSSGTCHVLTGCWDQKIRLFDMQTGECLVVLKEGHSDYVNCLLYDPWSQVLISAGADSKILIWSIETSRSQSDPLSLSFPASQFSITKTIRSHTRSIEAALLNMAQEGDDDNVKGQMSLMRLWTASSDTTVRCHTIPLGLPVFQKHPPSSSPSGKEQGHLTSVYCLATSPDSSSVYSGSADQRIIEWDTESGVVVDSWSFDDWIKSLVISSDEKESRYLFAGSREGYLFVMDRTENKVIRTITQGHFDEITSMRVSDGLLYTASLDGTLRRWPIHDLVHEMIEMDEPPSSMSNAIFGPSQVHDCVTDLTVEEEAELALLMADST